MSRLIPFIAIIFSIAVIFVYIKPTYSGSITTTKQQIASYDNALEAADRFEREEEELTAQRAQIPAESLNRLNEFLPDGVDNVQLILDLDALGARAGVTISDFATQNDDSSKTTPAATTANSTPATSGSTQSPAGVASSNAPLGGSGSQALTSSNPIDSLTLSFKATGTYSSFRTFLAGMENSLRPLDVTDLQITDSQNGVYTYEVTVRLYWLR